MRYLARKVRNSLPQKVVEAESISRFKEGIDRFMKDRSTGND